ncbi:zinc finger CCHC domain-containing protein 8 homolog [Scaptodrosophila lebanonensis]|uniref:Zinc finger CCHC domain-containing protein 8 homolog n=1 Tax=Drosophila lebanonensis TaxID=7225 RepID=A0A6J2TEI4_DROLE|nr:zinc finger CCHC domain-containing protein 8 homolog [Scaptodrosophila lebanonensis]
MGEVIEIFDDSVIMLDDSTDVDAEKAAEIEDGEVDDEADDEEVGATTETAATFATENPTVDDLDPQPAFEIKFRNRELYDKLHGRLLDLMQRKFAEENFTFKTPTLTNGEETTDDLSISVYTVSETSPAEPTIADNDLFHIDTKPMEKLNAAHVPSYKRSYSEVLDEETELRKKLKAEEADKCFRPKVQNSCFNCGQPGHSLRSCPKPRNNSRIQRARKSRTERYHVDVEQRLAHIRPGKISTKTRLAMGYSRGEVPFMFYRMRVLGYPPAWLEEAKVQSSGLSLFNADGTEVLKSDDEEGEADTFKYDINKIVDFPGFNVDLGPKFYDDYKHHNVPPFQEKDLKENFIKSLGENVIKGYKRRKLKNLPTVHDGTKAETSTTLGVGDMELEDDAEDQPALVPPPLPTEAPPEYKKPLPPGFPPTESEAKEERAPSPTLEDLQAQQAQLLHQLESNSTIDLSNLTVDSPSKSPTVLESSSSEQIPASTPFKASYAGTPILKFSVYDKLPVGDNFKKGVSDVINFENLPDSTGKYEQMKGVLKNVRDAMVRLQNEDE